VLTVSFAITCALCELVARVSWLRPLFGMGPAAASAPRAAFVREPLT
jgi:hypothetical protein